MNKFPLLGWTIKLWLDRDFFFRVKKYTLRWRSQQHTSMRHCECDKKFRQRKGYPIKEHRCIDQCTLPEGPLRQRKIFLCLGLLKKANESAKVLRRIEKEDLSNTTWPCTIPGCVMEQSCPMNMTVVSGPRRKFPTVRRCLFHYLIYHHVLEHCHVRLCKAFGVQSG